MTMQKTLPRHVAMLWFGRYHPLQSPPTLAEAATMPPSDSLRATNATEMNPSGGNTARRAMHARCGVDMATRGAREACSAWSA